MKFNVIFTIDEMGLRGALNLLNRFGGGQVMTARTRVLLIGLAALAMGAVSSAAAEDRRQGLDLTYLDARNGLFDLPEPSGPVPTGVRLGDEDGIDGLWPSIWGPIVPYAGFGLGKINLEMKLETGEIELEKEHDISRARLIAGLGYDVTRHVSLGLEYLAFADNDPLFALNLGGQEMEFDTKFTNHFLNFKARYKF